MIQVDDKVGINFKDPALMIYFTTQALPRTGSATLNIAPEAKDQEFKT